MEDIRLHSFNIYWVPAMCHLPCTASATQDSISGEEGNVCFDISLLILHHWPTFRQWYHLQAFQFLLTTDLHAAHILCSAGHGRPQARMCTLPLPLPPP